jgi:hypothetical protein
LFKSWKSSINENSRILIVLKITTLPTRGTRAPLTGNGVNAGIDSGYASMNQLPALVEGLEIIEE